MTLFLLAKHAAVPWSDREIVDAALKAAGERPLLDEEWNVDPSGARDAKRLCGDDGQTHTFQAALAARLLRQRRALEPSRTH